MKRDRPHCSSATLQRRAMLLVSLCVVASSSLVPEHDAPDAAEELPPPRLHLCLDGVDVEDGDAANPIMVPAHAAVLLEYETLSFDPASCGQLALLVLVDGAFHYKMQPVQPTGEVVFPHAFGAESHTLSVSILEAASGLPVASTHITLAAPASSEDPPSPPASEAEEKTHRALRWIEPREDAGECLVDLDVWSHTEVDYVQSVLRHYACQLTISAGKHVVVSKPLSSFEGNATLMHRAGKYVRRVHGRLRGGPISPKGSRGSRGGPNTLRGPGGGPVSHSAPDAGPDGDSACGTREEEGLEGCGWGGWELTAQLWCGGGGLADRRAEVTWVARCREDASGGGSGSQGTNKRRGWLPLWWEDVQQDGAAGMCHPAPDTEAPDKYTRQREAGEVAEDTQQREGEGVGRDTPRREGGEVRRAFETAGGAFFGPPAGEWGSVAFDNRGAEYRDTVVAASLPFRSPSNAKPPYVPSSTPKKPSNAHTRSGAEPAGPGGAGGGGVGEGGDGHPRESYSGGGEECGDLRFLVVTPARTAMRWVGYAVSSVRAQEHANWRMVVVDDASEDGTAEAARHAAQGDDRVTVIRNDERRGALANLLLAVDHADPADEEVVVVLDGDDWLAHPRALSLLCPAYNRHGAWVTYGTYLEFPTGLTPDWIVDFAPSVVEQKTFRQTAFVSSHLRTFKTFLLRAIPLAEFCYPVDRQDQGWGPLCPGGDTRMFDRAGADVAVMLPLLELAGHRIVRVPHVVHVYNVATPLNDFKVHLQEQWDVDSIVRGRARLERLPGARLFPAKPSVVVLSPPPNFRVKREAGGDVAIEYQVEGVWMPEEGLIELVLDGVVVHRTTLFSGALNLGAAGSMAIGHYFARVHLVASDATVLAAAATSFRVV